MCSPGVQTHSCDLENLHRSSDVVMHTFRKTAITLQPDKLQTPSLDHFLQKWALFISHEAVQVLISVRYTHRFIYVSQACHERVTSGYTSAGGQYI